MGDAAIVYFSGTGNTEYVAGLIKENLKNLSAELFRVEDILNGKVEADISEYNVLGIGAPSYGFNAPSIVAEFCESLNEVKGKKAFVFLTCGGPCYMNDVALFGIKRILKRKGYELIYEKVFLMPANVFLKYDDYIVKRLIEVAEKRAKEMAEDIANNVVRVRNDRFIPYLFRWLFVPMEFLGFRTFPLDFKVKESCNKCLKCVRNCPRKNIRINGKIKFGLKCQACFRCIYGCPQRAIKGRLSNFVILKEGYDFKKIAARCRDVEEKPLVGIFKSLEQYLNPKD